MRTRHALLVMRTPFAALALWAAAGLGACSDDVPSSAGSPGASAPGATGASAPGAPGASEPGASGASAPQAPGASAPGAHGSAAGDGQGGAAEKRRDGALDLIDEAAARGLDYVNVSGEAHKPTILDANGAGVALLDLGPDGGDGDLDAVFAQGLPSLAALLAGPGADVEVFANDGSGRFARERGPGLSGWWTGLAAGDADGDGDADLAVAAYGDLALLVQGERGQLAARAGAGTMPDPAQAPHARLVPGEPREAGRPPLWATSLAFYDGDRDGNLDLFVCQYLELDPVAPPIGKLGEGALALPCQWKGLEVYCGPRGMVPQPSRVLRGRGDGSFEDVTAEWTPGLAPAYSLAVGPFDADGDGDTDVFVANDSMPNSMLINDGSGRMQDAARAAGVAVSQEGHPEAGMGVAVGDVNRDGLLDFAKSNFSDEPTQLYFGAARGFTCETFRRGLGVQTKPLLSWSAHLCDFDADGALELFTANGHVYPQADTPGTGTRYAQRPTLWRLPPVGRVERVEPTRPDSLLALERGSRGSAVGDLDGDGDLDLVLARIDGPAGLGINASGRENARLLVRCVGASERSGPGPRTPRDGLGARVIVTPAVTGARPLVAEVQTAVGYQSASSPWLCFGLESAESYAALEVRWPSGSVERLLSGPADRRLWIEEGRGIVRAEPLW